MDEFVEFHAGNPMLGGIGFIKQTQNYFDLFLALALDFTGIERRAVFLLDGE